MLGGEHASSSSRSALNRHHMAEEDGGIQSQTDSKSVDGRMCDADGGWRYSDVVEESDRVPFDSAMPHRQAPRNICVATVNVAS